MIWLPCANSTAPPALRPLIVIVAASVDPIYGINKIKRAPTIARRRYVVLRGPADWSCPSGERGWLLRIFALFSLIAEAFLGNSRPIV